VPRFRLGVALLLPPPVCHQVDGLRWALGDPALGRIPSHLTLVPPVNVREEAVPDALAVLRAAAAETRPFRVSLGPVASFLPVNPVAYLAVGGDLQALHVLRDRVFTRPLERPLTWAFVPHVTIADEAAPDRIEAAVAALADFAAEVVFDRVHLLQQFDSRVWRPIADVEFGAPAVVGRGGPGMELELTVSERLDREALAFEAREWAAEPTGEQRVPLAVTARRAGRVVGVASGRIVRGPWAVGGAVGDAGGSVASRPEAGSEAGGGASGGAAGSRASGGPSGGSEAGGGAETACAHISTLIVAADERRTGVGSHLVAAFLSAAADLGAEHATVRTRNEAFYRRLGWVELARQPDGFVLFGRDLGTRH
jgi:2'-5' RNA ligase/ribosomal protein S18 acetylase RimI-like enzyme